MSIEQYNRRLETVWNRHSSISRPTSGLSTNSPTAIEDRHRHTDPIGTGLAIAKEDIRTQVIRVAESMVSYQAGFRYEENMTLRQFLGLSNP